MELNGVTCLQSVSWELAGVLLLLVLIGHFTTYIFDVPVDLIINYHNPSGRDHFSDNPDDVLTQVLPPPVLRRAGHAPSRSTSARVGRASRRANKVPGARRGGVNT